MSGPVLAPRDAQEAAALLADAAQNRRRLTPCGRRTRLGERIGEDTEPLSSAALTNGFAHYAGDLVATLPAGMTLSEVNRALAPERQWLPLDPLTGFDTTIGGLVAASDSGPRRHGYGSPRDLIIGIQVALSTGVVAHSGGRVVKNVAGYDLGRLFCGSKGSLGLIASVTFKLAPLPQTSRTLVARFATAGDAARAGLAIARSPLTPSCIEVVSPEPRLLVRFETTSSSAASMAAAAASLLPTGAAPETMEGDAESALWDSHRLAFASASLVSKLSVLPTAVPGLLDALARANVPLVSARVGLGIVDVENAGAGGLQELSQIAADHSGHLDVTRGPADASAYATRVGSAVAVMDAVKRRFDPAGILPYPWGRA